uniref:Uncharacterized protein n=1 Tax=Anguilla anguilla TaxID=7936 RepID=A0A0E9PDP6_ANGAN
MFFMQDARSSFCFSFFNSVQEMFLKERTAGKSKREARVHL